MEVSCSWGRMVGKSRLTGGEGGGLRLVQGGHGPGDLGEDSMGRGGAGLQPSNE